MIVQLTVGILFVFMSCVSCIAAEPSISARSSRISGNSASEPSASDGQIRALSTANPISGYEIILPVDTLGGMKYDPLSAYRAINWWDSPNVSVAFRLSLPPYVRSNRPPPVNKYVDYLQRFNEHKIASEFPSDQPYYVTVAASDFYRHVCPINPAFKEVTTENVNNIKRCVCGPKMLQDVWDNPEQMYMDPYIAKELLKDPNIKGLYIHELMVFSNGIIGRDHPFNCQKDKQDTPILWDKLIAYAEAARSEKKKIIWNDAGDEDAWKWLVNLLDRAPGTKKIDQDKATELFKNYGSVIVPLWANNRDTEDQNENDPCPSESTGGKRLSCDKINNSIKAVQKIALKYTSRYGASIQDWHTDANYYPKFIPKPPKDQRFHDCVERDIRNYILKAQEEKAKVFEFESYWTGEGFFHALLELKKALQSRSTISAGKWPRPMQCKKPNPPPKG